MAPLNRSAVLLRTSSCRIKGVKIFTGVFFFLSFCFVAMSGKGAITKKTSNERNAKPRKMMQSSSRVFFAP